MLALSQGGFVIMAVIGFLLQFVAIIFFMVIAYRFVKAHESLATTLENWRHQANPGQSGEMFWDRREP